VQNSSTNGGVAFAWRMLVKGEFWDSNKNEAPKQGKQSKKQGWKYRHSHNPVNILNLK